MNLFSVVTGVCSLLSRKSTKVVDSSLEQALPQQQSQPASGLPGQQGNEAQQVAEQLLEHLKPLWLSRHRLDLEVRFQTGRALLERLYPAGQERLPYGSQTMLLVSQQLRIAKPDLHRHVKWAREYVSLDNFKAKHPDVTSWDSVKKVLGTTSKAKADSSNQKPTDPVQVFLKNTHRTLDTLLSNSAKVPEGIKPGESAKCIQKAEAAFEKLRVSLSAVTSDNPPAKPST
jgi:hypothetical protein